jgi:hypothetical protein
MVSLFIFLVIFFKGIKFTFVVIVFTVGSRDRAVGIVIGYGLDDREVGVQVLVRSRIFSPPRRPN